MPRIYKSSRKVVLAAAVSVARERGLFNFSRIHVAQAADVAESTVSGNLGSMDELRTAVAQHAVDNEVMALLLDVAAIRRAGVSIPAALKDKIAAHIAR
jgi:DNA-binding transcriptional regulator YbjK